MKYLVTLQVSDPEGAMGDSPDLRDLRAWEHYLDIESDDETIRIRKVEVAE